MATREDDLQAIGQRVATARQRARLSQVELAVAIDCSRSTIARLEAGRGKRLAMWRLRQIADALDVRVETLLTEAGARSKGGTR